MKGRDWRGREAKRRESLESKRDESKKFERQFSKGKDKKRSVG